MVWFYMYSKRLHIIIALFFQLLTYCSFYSTLICLNFRFYLENWSKATMGNKLPLLWFGLQGYLIKSGGGGTTSVLLRKTNFFICHQFHGKKNFMTHDYFFSRTYYWPDFLLTQWNKTDFPKYWNRKTQERF